MQLHFDWSAPIPLLDGTKRKLIYFVDHKKLPRSPGIYIFGRKYGRNFEALYVGKASLLQGRIKGQFQNLRLMLHLKSAKSGKRVLILGKYIPKPGQTATKGTALAERALIRYFLSEGHDLVNIQGTQLRRHEIVSTGAKRVIPKKMYLDKAKGA